MISCCYPQARIGRSPCWVQWIDEWIWKSRVSMDASIYQESLADVSTHMTLESRSHARSSAQSGMIISWDLRRVSHNRLSSSSVLSDSLTESLCTWDADPFRRTEKEPCGIHCITVRAFFFVDGFITENIFNCTSNWTDGCAIRSKKWASRVPQNDDINSKTWTWFSDKTVGKSRTIPQCESFRVCVWSGRCRDVSQILDDLLTGRIWRQETPKCFLPSESYLLEADADIFWKGQNSEELKVSLFGVKDEADIRDWLDLEGDTT